MLFYYHLHQLKTQNAVLILPASTYMSFYNHLRQLIRHNVALRRHYLFYFYLHQVSFDVMCVFSSWSKCLADILNFESHPNFLEDHPKYAFYGHWFDLENKQYISFNFLGLTLVQETLPTWFNYPCYIWKTRLVQALGCEGTRIY